MATAPTASSARGGVIAIFRWFGVRCVFRGDLVVHHDLAGREAGLLEEVLGGAMAGQRNGIDAEALAVDEPSQSLPHHRLTDTDTARPLLDEQLFDHAET